MCANYFLQITEERLIEQFGVSYFKPPKSSEIYPKYTVPAVVRMATGTRELWDMQWKLIPANSGDPSPHNARAETVAKYPVFRDAFLGRRCLMPASGYYEWKKEEDGSKQRYLFTLPGQQPFAFAGIWNGGEVPSCALITTIPNSFMANFHDRMPVILKPDDYEKWLNPKEEVKGLQQLLKPWDGELYANPASKATAS